MLATLLGSRNNRSGSNEEAEDQGDARKGGAADGEDTVESLEFDQLHCQD